jgi:hypothetical protein
MMIKITNEIDGKKYELVKSEDGCKQCDFRKFCVATPRCIDACDVCGALYGHFEKVVMRGE